MSNSIQPTQAHFAVSRQTANATHYHTCVSTPPENLHTRVEYFYAPSIP